MLSIGEWCRKCMKYHEPGEHIPVFEVAREPDHVEDDYWTEVRALDAETAAETWASRYDSESAEYDIVGGRSEPIVSVRAADGTITRFQVRGEAVPSYRATEIEPTSREVGGSNDER